MTIEVHSWDYVFALVYGIVLLISLVGVAKYAIRAQVLTIAIMVTNVLSIGCKYMLPSLTFVIFTDREVLFLVLFGTEGDKVVSDQGRSFYYFFFALAYHCFTVVSFLLLLNW